MLPAVLNSVLCTLDDMDVYIGQLKIHVVSAMGQTSLIPMPGSKVMYEVKKTEREMAWQLG